MFRAHVLIISRSKLHYTASGIITTIGGRLVHETATCLYLGQPNPVHIPTSNLLEILPNIIQPFYLFNPLTPNDPYSGRTAPLTSKRCILYIYSTNIGTEYF